MMTKATFYKAGNDLWFLGIYSNNYEDTQQDIISKAAHEEYAEWLQKTGIKPPITVAHSPKYTDIVHFANYLGLMHGKYTAKEYSNNLQELYKAFAIAETVAVMPINGFTLVVGKVFESKKDLVEKLMTQQKSWGMSHGFIPIRTSGNIIEKYRSFEFTVVPSELAVNKITSVNIKRSS